MTKLPPGRACFPQQLSKSEDYELHGRNRTHVARWAQVRALSELSPTTFKKKTGFKKTLTKIHELVGETEEKPITAGAVKKSCEKVDKAIKTGNSSQFFFGDMTPTKLGKKRRPSR